MIIEDKDLAKLIEQGVPKHYVKNGLLFGYPKCCIIDFCLRDWYMSPNQLLAHQNTGFVPCPYCSTKVVKGEVKLEDLIVNRLYQVPFPA